MTKRLSILLIVSLVAYGCVAGMQTKSFMEMTPKERVGFAKSVYNNAAGEYVWQYEMRRNDDGVLSRSDVDFLMVYYETLRRAHKAILVYEAVEVTLSTTDHTSAEAEDMLVQAIRDMTMLLEK